MSLGSVVVLGAGMSLHARYPDTFGLNGLLWDALDADLAARADLARRLKLRDELAKALVGDDFSKWNEAWLSVAGSQPDEPWVLPHEDGFVGQELLRQLAELADEYPRTLIAIGYSESDRAVVDNLITPLDTRWRTCRCGPHVEGTDDIVGTADEVLTALAKPLAQREDSCVWAPTVLPRARVEQRGPAPRGCRSGHRDPWPCRARSRRRSRPVRGD
jgi:hypothetical protein